MVFSSLKIELKERSHKNIHVCLFLSYILKVGGKWLEVKQDVSGSCERALHVQEKFISHLFLTEFVEEKIGK